MISRDTIHYYTLQQNVIRFISTDHNLTKHNKSKSRPNSRDTFWHNCTQHSGFNSSTTTCQAICQIYNYTRPSFLSPETSSNWTEI